jgi:hypothetical protein
MARLGEAGLKHRSQRRRHVGTEQAGDAFEVDPVGEGAERQAGRQTIGRQLRRAIEQGMAGRGGHARAVAEVEVDAAPQHDLADDVLVEVVVDQLHADVAPGLEIVQDDVQAGRHHDALDAAGPALVVDDETRAGVQCGLAAGLVDQPLEIRHDTPRP